MCGNVQVRLQFWEQRSLLPFLPAGQHSSSDSSSSSSGRPDSKASGAHNSLSLLQGSSTGPTGSVSAFAAAAGSGSGSGSGAAAGGGPPPPDLDSSLVHQKLQMLNMCIWRRDKRLARGSSVKQQQQQQQQRLRSRQASSNSILGSKSNNGGAAQDDDADSNAEAAQGSAAGRSSNKLSGLATAASSTFYSVTGDEEGGADADADADAGTVDDNQAEAAVAAGSNVQQQDWAADDADSAAVGKAAAEQEVGPRQGLQQAVQQDVFEDASSEFYSVSGAAALSNNSSGGAGAEPNSASAALQAVSDPDADPQGVAAVVPGQYLLLYPDRPLRVPVVQDGPVFTEDQMIQRQMALMQLATAAADSSRAKSADAAAELLLLKQRLLAAPLLSDMCAFKAANPGCCFEDFLRWYSPKDWQQQAEQPQQQQQCKAEYQQQQQSVSCSGLSGAQGTGSNSMSSSEASSPTPAPEANLPANSRETSAAKSPTPFNRAPGSAAAPAAAGAGGGGNAAADAGDDASEAPGGACSSARMVSGPRNDWQQLWLLAEPQPAAAQRPLMNPQKEGELVSLRPNMGCWGAG